MKKLLSTLCFSSQACLLSPLTVKQAPIAAKKSGSKRLPFRGYVQAQYNRYSKLIQTVRESSATGRGEIMAVFFPAARHVMVYGQLKRIYFLYSADFAENSMAAAPR
jgi:hypothetical protein